MLNSVSRMVECFRWGTLVTLLAFAQSSQAVESGSSFRVGYVDLQKALTTVDEGKSARSRLELEMTKKRTELEKEQVALQKEAEQFEKKVALMNEKARAEQQQTLQKKFMDFQRKMAESQGDLQKRERDLTKPIIDKLKAIVEVLAKGKKLNLVLEKNEGAVLYADAGTDLTEDVIKEFDKKPKK